MLANVRAAWEAVNNNWNQWVLNYSQAKQLNLLKDIGFESPSWEDLFYVLTGLLVVVSLAGAAWTRWEKSRHDPWLGLLWRAQKQLRQAGVELPDSAPPRTMAQLVLQRMAHPTSQDLPESPFPHGAHVRSGRDSWQAVADWLLKLEALRYAPVHGRDGNTSAVSLQHLQREFGRLPWPQGKR
jgi:protein-glutamine gamma-glutamyltransferase